VTLCIAAIAENGKDLVLVNDTKVSFGSYLADKAFNKNIPFIGEYALLIAGDDVAHAGAVIHRATVAARKLRESDEIAEVLFRECQVERDRIVEARILKKHLFDTKTFQQKGKHLCTDAVFYDIHSRMEHIPFSLDFILAGFDLKGNAHIRFTNCDTPPQDYDAIGFWAIGSGATSAIGSYCHAVEYLHTSRNAPIAEVAYHTLAAKFMAESASDVGKDTFFVALRSVQDSTTTAQTQMRFLSFWGGMEYVRKRWEKDGAPRMPKGMSQALEDLMHSHEEGTSPEIVNRIQKYLDPARRKISQAAATSKAVASKQSVSQT
jgi:hypothetical protein